MIQKHICLFAAIILACLFAAGNASAQSPVAITIDSKTPGATISPDFMGLSFEMSRVLADSDGGHYFSVSNKALLKTFRVLGIKNLRLGGNTVDRSSVKIPSHEDLDNLFDFAKAAGVKVIFALRLLDSTPEAAVEQEKYIMDHHKDCVLCFAIGNEPNVYIKGENAASNYCEQARQYMAAVRAVAPAAQFCGPGTISGNWSTNYARAFAHSDQVKFVTQHSYPGGSGNKAANDPARSIDRMLSARWQQSYERAFNSFVPETQAAGLPFRLEEANNFYNGGAKGVSDTFASALWGLDYLYWWAAHGADGVNFHTGDFVAAEDQNTPCRYAVFTSAPRGYFVHPLGYAVKAFTLCSQGRLLPVKIATNTNSIDLTAYAVLADGKKICVTLINKEHGAEAHDAIVTLSVADIRRKARVLRLNADRITNTDGARLGGSEIGDNGAWRGTWQRLSIRADGSFLLNIPSASAALVELIAK